jgi:TetR/AcrR family transcriptional regulator, cholesterol catabolism regulator
MPRTRRDVDRADKVAEIVEVAKRQALEGGYQAMSMAAIARELRVAQNAVYWYFPTRDHLFVAVLRQLVAEVVARKPPSTRDEFERAVWLVDRVAEVHPLLVAMRERAAVAEVVRDFERELDAVVRSMVSNAFAGAVSEDELGVAIESFLATVEGALLRQLAPAERARVVTFTLGRLSGRQPPGPPAGRMPTSRG